MAEDAVVASPDLIHTLAHDLRQPLSTIESIAYYLTLILPEDEKTREQLDRIQQLVEQSNWMLTSAQLLSDSIAAATQEIDLRELISGLAVAAIGEELPAVHGDPNVIRAAIENIATLYRQFAFPGSFRVTRLGDRVLMEVEAKGTIFPGATLSLEGVRRVIEAHGGSFEATLDPSVGLKLRVVLT